jgi:hypothetical protein
LRQGVSIATTYARLLIACRRHTDVYRLVNRALMIDSALIGPLEPLVCKDSPIAATFVAEHRSVCAARMDETGVVDLGLLVRSEWDWRSGRQTA